MKLQRREFLRLASAATTMPAVAQCRCTVLSNTPDHDDRAVSRGRSNRFDCARDRRADARVARPKRCDREYERRRERQRALEAIAGCVAGPAGARLSVRGAARGFGAAGIVIGGGSAGACAPSEIPSVAFGAGTVGALSGTTDRAPDSAGFGGAAPAAAADSRAAFSIASICLDCCSSSRNVSQLVSRVVSTVRLGAGSAPLSATIKAGGAAPAACGGALSVSSASSMASPRSTLTVGLQIGAVGPHDDVAQARLPRVDADRGGRLRHRQAGIVERAGDEFPNAIAAGRNAKLDGAGHRVEHVGIEPDQPRLFERDGAEAGQRADERGGAAAGAFDLGLQASGGRTSPGVRRWRRSRRVRPPVMPSQSRAVRPAAAFETASRPSRRPLPNSPATSSNTTSEPFEPRHSGQMSAPPATARTRRVAR